MLSVDNDAGQCLLLSLMVMLLSILVFVLGMVVKLEIPKKFIYDLRILVGLNSSL